MGSLLWSTAANGGGTAEPSYGPAPAPLDGPELPSFRYPLGSKPTKTFDGGTAKEANVTEFPVSEKLAGVYMTLEPGALRELHWHANAAEWAYVIEGNCRVTTIDPQNQCEIVDFGPGDVWYFPRGHGHSIQGLGPAPAPSCWCSTTAISPSSAPSPSPTGSATPRPRCWPRPSASGRDLRRLPQEGSLYRHRPGAAGAARGPGARLAERAAAHPSLPSAGAATARASPAAPCAPCPSTSSPSRPP